MPIPSGKSGLLAAGNWIADTTKLIDVYPSQDTLANILGQERNNGGGAYNVLVDLARLGATFPLRGLGLVGDDPVGDWIRQDAEAHGIDTTLLQTHPTAATSYTDVMSVQSTGRRTFFHQRGANAFLGPEHFPWNRIDARIFYLGYLLLLDRLDAPDPDHGIIAARVLADAGEHGLLRVVDLVSVESADYASLRPALPFIDLLICNELEASRVTGIPIRDEGEAPRPGTLLAAARALLELGVRESVVIHLPEGAVAVSATGETWQQASVRLPAREIRGAAGAGDAFAAGILHGLHADAPMAECLRAGVCAAAACLRDNTTSRGLLPLAECLALGELHGHREPLF